MESGKRNSGGREGKHGKKSHRKSKDKAEKSSHHSQDGGGGGDGKHSISSNDDKNENIREKPKQTLHSTITFPRRKLQSTSMAQKKYQRAILEITSELSHEFHTEYLDKFLKGEFGRRMLDVRKPGPSYESIKKGFLFYLNSSGKFLILREHLRDAVINLIHQKSLTSFTKGVKSHQEYDDFLHDCYFYMMDTMSDILHSASMQEGSGNCFRFNNSGTKLRIGNTRSVPKLLDNLLIYAQEALAQYDYENAHRIHIERVARSGDSDKSWIDFSLMWLSRGDDRLAQIAAREALTKNPHNSLALLINGLIEVAHGHEEGIKFLEAALKNHQMCPELHVILSIAHGRLENVASSKFYLNEAQKIHQVLTGQKSTLSLSQHENSHHKSNNKKGKHKSSLESGAAPGHRDKHKKRGSDRSVDSAKENRKGSKDSDTQKSTTEKSSRKSSRKVSHEKRKSNIEHRGSHNHHKGDGDMLTVTDHLPIAKEIKIDGRNIETTKPPLLGKCIQVTWNVTKISRGKTKEPDPDLFKVPQNTENTPSENETKDITSVFNVLLEGREGKKSISELSSKSEKAKVIELIHHHESLENDTEEGGEDEPQKSHHHHHHHRHHKKVEIHHGSMIGSLKTQHDHHHEIQINMLSDEEVIDEAGLEEEFHDEHELELEGEDHEEETDQEHEAHNISARSHAHSKHDKKSHKSHKQSQLHDKSNKVYSRRQGSELIWTAQLLLKLRLFDYLDTVLTMEISKHNERSVAYLYIRAMSLHLRGRDEEAAEVVGEALKADPDNSILWSLRGHIYYNLRDKEEAMGSYEKSLMLPHARESLHLIYLRYGALCIEKGELEMAKRVFLKRVGLAPTPYLWIAFGNTCYHLGSLDEAMVAFSEANKLDNSNPVIWANLSLICLAQGNKDLAEQSYKWAIRFGLKNCKLLEHIKELHKKLGYGNPGFLKIPYCMPHEAFVERLGRDNPLEVYEEMLNFRHLNRPKTPFDNTEREDILIEKLKSKDEERLEKLPAEALEVESEKEETTSVRSSKLKIKKGEKASKLNNSGRKDKEKPLGPALSYLKPKLPPELSKKGRKSTIIRKN